MTVAKKKGGNAAGEEVTGFNARLIGGPSGRMTMKITGVSRFFQVQNVMVL